MKRLGFLVFIVVLTACGRESRALEFRPVDRDVQIHRDVGPGREIAVLSFDRSSSVATVGYYAGARCGTVRGPDHVSALYEADRLVIAVRFPGGRGPTCADAVVGAIEVKLPSPIEERTIVGRRV
jgi:hypothetical protein